MTREIFLLLNLALAFYNTGTIWAHEIDIFRTWKLVDPHAFHRIQQVHWRKIPYWVFVPVGLSFAGSVALFWYHPLKIATGEIILAFGTQFLSHVLTGIFWGPWQAKLSQDPAGSKSIYLHKILKSHWVRTSLITLYSVILFYMMVETKL